VRALLDDGAAEPSKITRDYLLRLDGDHGRAPVLSVFGGKITTYRRLAERALERLGPWFPGMRAPWTQTARLPGGDMPGGDIERYADELAASRRELPPGLIRALVQRHGSRAPDILGVACKVADLGVHFGGNLYEREVEHFRAREWAYDAEDVLWRRTKAGLHLNFEQQARVSAYMAAQPPMR
jgi:glycerol-3-phosphate dehydrogenase